MDYNEFLEFIRDNLSDCYREIMLSEKDKTGDTDNADKLPEDVDDCEVSIQHVIKNNGIILDAVSIYQNGEQISPNIYLKPYYDSYQMGKPLDFILAEIICQYRKEREETNIKYIDLDVYDRVKDKLILRIVNYDRNREMLKECPHKRFLDLAIVFRYIVSDDMLGIASIQITDREFSGWDIGLDELYNIALFNTMQNYPWQMDPLTKIVFDCFEDRLGESLSADIYEDIKHMKNEMTGVNLFILSNNQKVFGAACILYDNVIRNFARVQDSNIYIMPSSVHEVMLIPEDDNTDPEFLHELLSDANRTSVGLIDLLSDNLYYYDLEKDRIELYYPD